MIYTSVVQSIKFRVKIVRVYMLVKRTDALILACLNINVILKPINLAKLKEDDLNKKNALVKHCFNCEHRIDFGNFEILNYNIDYDKQKFLESLNINNTKNSINDKDRNVFPKIYSNIKNLNECGFSTC